MLFPGYTVDIGKTRRLKRMFSTTGKCLLVPLDDSLISGPENGLYDIRAKAAQIEKSKPSAIMAFPGTMSLIQDVSIPLVLNLTASTAIGQHTNKVLVSSVERAVALGAEAVAVHINFSSKYESDMLRNAEYVKRSCDQYGMPLMIMAYPRTEGTTADNNYLDIKSSNNAEYTKIVCHCVRVAFEIGADIIKAQYTGNAQSFEKVVQSAVDKPVLIAGGKPENLESLFSMVQGAMTAGASGLSVGRYVFNDNHTDVLIETLKQMVFNGMPAIEAREYYSSQQSNT